MRKAIAQTETSDVSLSVARTSLAELAQTLQEAITQKLVAFMVGISDGGDVGRYARGERKPHFTTQIKLRDLYGLIHRMLKSEGQETIQVWFMGKNPELDNRPPAFFFTKTSMAISSE
jgi:hypothetical protein